MNKYHATISIIILLSITIIVSLNAQVYELSTNTENVYKNDILLKSNFRNYKIFDLSSNQLIALKNRNHLSIRIDTLQFDLSTNYLSDSMFSVSSSNQEGQFIIQPFNNPTAFYKGIVNKKYE